MLKPIVVPLDGSALAEQALAPAARLARAGGAELHLIHVHTPRIEPISEPGLPVIDAELRSQAARHEHAYLERAAAGLGLTSPPPRAVRMEGPVAPMIVGYARDVSAGLIVLTTHGRSGLAQLWLGSIAEALIATAQVPILLLRPVGASPLATRPLRRILVPLDGSPLAEHILGPASELARLDGAELTLLRVVDTLPVPELMPYAELYRLDQATAQREHSIAATYLAEVADRLRGDGLVVSYSVCEADNPARAILAAAEEQQPDLIALATHGRSGLERAVLGSVANKLLRASALPLLVLRPSATDARSQASLRPAMRATP